MSRLTAFGHAVREQRHALGISQELFAERAKLHQTYVSGIERGKRNPTLSVIWRLADALEIGPGDLLLRTEGYLSETD